MDREITIEYEEKAVSRAYSRYWLSSSGWVYIIAGLMTGLIFLLLLVSGREPMMTGFFGGAFCMLASYGYWGYAETVRSATARLKSLPFTSFIIRLTDERFFCRTDLFSSEIDWRLFDKLLRFGDLWLMFERQYPLAMLPVQTLDEETKRFILSKISENGGEVV